jgi:hypothetical protein
VAATVQHLTRRRSLELRSLLDGDPFTSGR